MGETRGKVLKQYGNVLWPVVLAERRGLIKHRVIGERKFTLRRLGQILGSLRIHLSLEFLVSDQEKGPSAPLRVCLVFRVASKLRPSLALGSVCREFAETRGGQTYGVRCARHCRQTRAEEQDSNEWSTKKIHAEGPG